VLLSGRVAIVTGASRGIGAATARALVASGAAVALAARDEDALNALAEELSGLGASAVAVPTDVTQAESVARLVDKTLDHFGRLDVACNNAASTGPPPTLLADLPADSFDTTITITLRGVFLSMKYEIRAMLASGGGSIVNMTSTAGLQAVGGKADYVSAKHGVVGLTKTAALDYADQNIRVNALAPGPILTDSLEHAGADAQRYVASTLPIRRLGRAEDVADAIVWLCSHRASFITGAILPIDGGKLAGTPPFAPTPARTTGAQDTTVPDRR
jgi:NAD(P)-dependent dehydrogenase (short-subunit alcohol dehydrogenase family)